VGNAFADRPAARLGPLVPPLGRNGPYQRVEPLCGGAEFLDHCLELRMHPSP
jgi:hypothetical protein